MREGCILPESAPHTQLVLMVRLGLAAHTQLPLLLLLLPEA